MHSKLAILPAFLISSTAFAAPADIPAFPGAEGFGALATGGRGGEIVHVTTLADSGAGSLREAVSKPNRVVLFDVAGTIKLESNLEFSDNLTIAGQSAFASGGTGICIYNKSASFSNHKNIIVRYIRFREGINGDRGKCSVNIATGSNMIFDHCSIEWGRWDCLGCTVNSHDITFQYCMIGEGLDPQQFGALVDSVENVTISHNLWINNHSRNPKGKGTIEYINNVVYNWQITGLCGGHSAADHSMDVIGNVFVKGPSSNNQALGQFTATDHVFQKDNLLDLDRDGKFSGKAAVESDFKDSGGNATFIQTAWAKPRFPVTVDSAQVAWKKVLATAGCSLQRDAVDARLINEAQSLGTQGKTIKNEAEAGGLAEIKPTLIHHDLPESPGALAPSGYMAIEVYLNQLAEPKTPG